MFSKLYWFFYIAQNTTDSDVALELYYTQERPFGHMGGVSATWETDPNRDSVAVALERQRRREDEAIKLYATLNQNYLRQFWNLEDLVATADRIIDDTDNDLSEEQKVRLADIRGILQRILDYYDSVRRS